VIAVDTNLLVYAHRAALPEHGAARHAIERAARLGTGWGISQPSLAEFWSVVTHPAATGRPSTGTEASRFLASLVRDGGARIWLPGVGFGDRLVELAARLDVQGPRIFDLQIGLLALEHGAHEIWTHDRRFVTLPGLRIRDPL
jgi:toxin-antitoxin system PIN domain toxin